jgi:hypothetical protein
MTGRQRAAVVLLAMTVACAGCGSAASQASLSAQHAQPRVPALNTALGTTAGTWAVAVMGGSAAQHNNFWQLFARPPGHTGWRLATPPGVASNGGLVIAGLGGRSLVAGFRPSQDLLFTPLATTRDGGSAWTSGLLDAALADVPGSLAADPASGRLLALLADGTVELSAPRGAGWTPLTTRRSITSSAAGRRCGLRTLTAVAFSPRGAPMLAASCSRPGVAGIFIRSGQVWQLTGPALPASLGRQDVAVLGLTASSGDLTALLAAGSGSAASLLAAWSTDNGRHWTLSPVLRPHRAIVASASFGPGGGVAIVLTGSHAAALTGAGATWRSLPTLPPGTATLALGARGAIEALAVRTVRLTVWRLVSGHAWTTAQVIKVPIQFGSSS